MRKIFILPFIFLMNFLGAQTSLTQGDIAFIGLNFDGNDDCVFILLKDVDASTTINFTDCGWEDGTSSFICNTGDVNGWTWTSGQNLSIGQTITLKLVAPMTASIGSISGSTPVMSSIGDQILAYQGSSGSPTFVAGVHSNEPSTDTNWSGSTSNNQTSALPDVLTNGMNAIRLHNGGTEVDNWQYDCSVTSGTADVVRNAINNISNWVSDNNSAYSPADPGCSWSISPSLPVELVSFNLFKNDLHQIKITWETATEINNDYFTIEKSIDLKDWIEVAQIQGIGDSEYHQSYEFLDRHPFLGLSYYRLKQTDFDGSFEYHDVKSVFVELNDQGDSKIYPNPSRGQVTIFGENLKMNELHLYDILGQNLTAKLKLTKAGTSTFDLDLTNLPNGIYWLITKTQTHKIQVLKE